MRGTFTRVVSRIPLLTKFRDCSSGSNLDFSIWRLLGIDRFVRGDLLVQLVWHPIVCPIRCRLSLCAVNVVLPLH